MNWQTAPQVDQCFKLIDNVVNLLNKYKKPHQTTQCHQNHGGGRTLKKALHKSMAETPELSNPLPAIDAGERDMISFTAPTQREG